MMKRVFIDASKCDGCLKCSIACMNAHRHGEDKTKYIDTLDLSDLDNETRNFIRTNDKGEIKPIFCRHCAIPECAGACMSGALSKSKETGHVMYDKARCGSCFMCVMSCPFGLPKPDNKTNSHVIKCDFCEFKGSPSCVEACPTGALYVIEAVM